MIFLLALSGFFLFTLVFCLVSGAIIYHINAYTLPGWTLGRTAITVFVITSAILLASAGYSFLHVPWNSFEPKAYNNTPY